MPTLNRVVLIVLDSVGVGALPDASLYGDEGSNTLANTAKAVGGLRLPNLEKMGLGCIIPIMGLHEAANPRGFYGKMAESSPGKDTTTGHWEIAGIILDQPFPTYPQGFPPEIIAPLEQATGRRVLGNKVASGTEIIEELGPEHQRSGRPIVYTSADSVFQVAAHEEVIPLEELYGICKFARNILTGPHAVGRVIARPFVGQPGAYQRTSARKDFSLSPPGPTALDILVAAGTEVVGIGKIEDIFAGRGISRAVHTKDNQDGINHTLEAMSVTRKGFIFTNLVDFDMRYGHRNDAKGYAKALEDFDARLPELLAALGDKDALIITADHGCDPTIAGTDHTREYVPLLICLPWKQEGVFLGNRSTFSDLGATVADLLGVAWKGPGASMGELILKRQA